jgi:hypothetical protein
MPDLAPYGASLLTLLVVAVLGWFALGTQLNIRKGERAMKWLEEGLPLLGPRTTVRWLGSSVAELVIVAPRPPLRMATILIVLEPRDLGALWLFARRRGRRDFLLLRLHLQRAPRFRADAIDPEGWTAHDRRADDAPFAHERMWNDTSGAPVRIRYDDEARLGHVRRYWDRIAALSGGIWRISVSPLVPHLEIHVLLPRTEMSAKELLGAVRELAEAISPER